MLFYPKQITDSSLFNKGFYLWLLKANATPPHLLVSYNGKYYNLSVKGKYIAEPLEILIKNIQSKQIPTLIFSLNSFNNIELTIQDAYNSFKKVALPETTCLSPIKKIAEMYGVNSLSIHTIHDLLPILTEKNIITSSFHYFLLKISEKQFELPSYTISDVYACIDSLSPEKHAAGKQSY
jgi:hypothetical protein